MNEILLLAQLPLPPSVNNANGHTSTGAVYKKEHVKKFREEVYAVITHWERVQNKSQFLPSFIEYIDRPAIEKIRWAYSKKSKEALAARKHFRMSVLEVVNKDSRDADNGHKELQDAIFAALIGINDKRVISIKREITVDPTATEHCEVAIETIERTWKSGDLIGSFALRLQLNEMYAAPYCTDDYYSMGNSEGNQGGLRSKLLPST